LIGVHTCCVVACVIFSKKGSICEKKSATESTGPDTVSTVSTSSITTTKFTGTPSASPAASPCNSISVTDTQSTGSESVYPIMHIRLGLQLVNHSHDSIPTSTTIKNVRGLNPRHFLYLHLIVIEQNHRVRGPNPRHLLGQSDRFFKSLTIVMRVYRVRY